MLSVSLFDFELPDELIARYPAERRDGSRMLVLDRETGDFEIRPFTALPEYLTAGDALLCNNALVRRARMFGRKEGRDEGAKFEILLLAPDTDGLWNVMLKPGKRALPGTRVYMMTPEGAVNTRGDHFTVVSKNSDNSYKIAFSDPVIENFEMRYGHIPLPPYLNREAEPLDLERYQTVYAQVPGAVAAPTAGLHFTPEILETLRQKGVGQAALTLRVGAGTFLPVKTDVVEEHKMHSEHYALSQETADIICEVNSPDVRILYDVYHQQISEGNVIETIRNNIDLIGHIHVGDVPGRQQPGTGELNRLLQRAMEINPPGQHRTLRKRLKLFYATTAVNEKYTTIPVPTYVLFVNDKRLLVDSYAQFLRNTIRSRINAEGIPIVLSPRSRVRNTD